MKMISTKFSKNFSKWYFRLTISNLTHYLISCINKEVLKSAVKISDQLFACTSRTVDMPNFDLCPNFGVVNKHWASPLLIIQKHFFMINDSSACNKNSIQFSEQFRQSTVYTLKLGHRWNLGTSTV